MKKERKVEIIEEAFDQIGLSATPYEEDGKIVGWETEGYTDRGGDMIVLIDLRDKNLDALNFSNLIDVVSSTFENIDIDEEVDAYMSSAKEFGLTTREATEDISDYYESLQDKAKDFYIGFLNDEIKPYVHTTLEEDTSVLTGGLSYTDEKLDNFILEADILTSPDYDPANYGLKELNEDLRDCGIAKIIPQEVLEEANNDMEKMQIKIYADGVIDALKNENKPNKTVSELIDRLMDSVNEEAYYFVDNSTGQINWADFAETYRQNLLSSIESGEPDLSDKEWSKFDKMLDQFVGYMENYEKYTTTIMDQASDSFIDDNEKMEDFFHLTKADFLKSYSYLTEQEYDTTFDDVLRLIYDNSSTIHDREKGLLNELICGNTTKLSLSSECHDRFFLAQGLGKLDEKLAEVRKQSGKDKETSETKINFHKTDIR